MPHRDEPGVVRCPRCEINVIAGGGAVLPSAVSRTARDDGPEVAICPDCGDREAFAEARGALPHFTAWPLPIETLVSEDRIRFTAMRNGRFALMEIGPDDARRMLGEE